MKPAYQWLAGALTCAVATMGVASCSGGDDGDDDPTDPVLEGAIQASVTADGAPLPGVTVRLFADGGTTALASGNTAGGGQTTFAELDPDAYDVEVVILAGYELAPGQTARKDVTVVADQTASVSFVLREIEVLPTVGQVRARVLDGATGVTGVEVRLFAAGGTTVLETLATGADGRALFESLDPGDYDVEITLPEDFEVAPGDTTRKEVTVTAGATTDVQFGVDGPEPTTIDIFAGGTSFSDEDVTIAPGTTVRWIWSNGDHTVTPTGHSEWTSTALNSSGDMLVHTFNNVGTFNYHCIPHQSLGMTGVVRVQ